MLDQFVFCKGKKMADERQNFTGEKLILWRINVCFTSKILLFVGEFFFVGKKEIGRADVMGIKIVKAAHPCPTY